jgi:hypothetical protein
VLLFEFTVKCTGNFFLVTVCYSDHLGFWVNSNAMALLSSVENEVQKVQQKVKTHGHVEEVN